MDKSYLVNYVLANMLIQSLLKIKSIIIIIIIISKYWTNKLLYKYICSRDAR